MDSTADGGRRPRAAGATERPATVAELFTPARRSLTIGLVSTITLVAFEALAISTIMPTVEAELGQIELLGWVFSGFFLGNLIGIVVVGGLIDRASLTRLFTVALGLFAVGLLVGGLAPSMPVLVAGRVLQGLGGGAIPPVAYVAIGRSMPDRLRPRMFALLSTAWVVPGLMGPWIAANVAVAFNWRVVFLGLLPLLVGAGLIALAGLRTVPTADEAAAAQGHKGASETEHAAAAATARRLPYALLLAGGGALLDVGFTIVGPVTVAGVVVPPGVLTVASVAAGLMLLVPAFRHLTPVGTLRMVRGLPATILLRGMLTFSFFAVDAYVPLTLQRVRGLDPQQAGLALTAATLTWTAGSWIQARTNERLGIRRLVGAGFVVVAIGLATFGLVFVPSAPLVLAVGGFAVAGGGMGLGYGTLAIAVLRVAAPGAEGEATSSLQLSDVLGTAIGTGLGGALVAFGDRNGDIAMGAAIALVVALSVAVTGSVASGRVTPAARRASAPAFA